MQLTDTHCHIQDVSEPMWASAGEPSAEAMITRAATAGVTRLICVGTTVSDSAKATEFVQDREHCWASIGLHPHDAKGGATALDALAALVTNPLEQKIVAIGECGLDYHYSLSTKTDQIVALRSQIELALQHNLPLIFHVRDALDDFWPIFDSYKNLRGVMHSFTDTPIHLEKALARGLYIGVNGITTFKNNHAQQAMVAQIPLQKLLLETDAPFLTPVPLRGKVNEPANVALVAKFLADLRGEPIAQIAKLTTQNAQTLFNLN
ncbi:MAG TPA: TatD family hydrolase [Candidatus Saccharimonas sp.]|nr:TatD family hydrolase [Candidatus Saccharimonas sp.]